MSTIRIQFILLVLALTSFLTACKKDGVTEPDQTSGQEGIYILSQGLFNSNNSKLGFYNMLDQQINQDIFTQVNQRGLGDTGNDIQAYGQKLYVVMNGSNTVEVMDLRSVKSIRQIELKDGARGRGPRNVVFHQQKAYVSSYDGTVAVIDTASLQIESFIQVGRNPEQMAIANGKLYVANSGGLSFPNYDNKVSVVDLNTKMVIKTIQVTENPVGMHADQYGEVYVLSFGNYADVAPAMSIINSETDLVSRVFDNFGALDFHISGDLAYFIGLDSQLKIFNVKSEIFIETPFITDGTTITNPLAIHVDPLKNEILVSDAKNYAVSGELFVFNAQGKKLYSLPTGIIPTGIAVLKP